MNSTSNIGISCGYLYRAPELSGYIRENRATVEQAAGLYRWTDDIRQSNITNTVLYPRTAGCCMILMSGLALRSSQIFIRFRSHSRSRVFRGGRTQQYVPVDGPEPTSSHRLGRWCHEFNQRGCIQNRSRSPNPETRSRLIHPSPPLRKQILHKKLHPLLNSPIYTSADVY